MTSIFAICRYIIIIIIKLLYVGSISVSKLSPSSVHLVYKTLHVLTLCTFFYGYF